MDENGKLLVCDSRADLVFQFDTRKRELLRSWVAHGDGAADMTLDRARHRLFVGTRIPAEMTVYDSQSGKEIVSLPGPETMDGVSYDSNLKRILEEAAIAPAWGPADGRKLTQVDIDRAHAGSCPAPVGDG